MVRKELGRGHSWTCWEEASWEEGKMEVRLSGEEEKA